MIAMARHTELNEFSSGCRQPVLVVFTETEPTSPLLLDITKQQERLDWMDFVRQQQKAQPQDWWLIVDLALLNLLLYFVNRWLVGI